ncbi:MAG: TIGR01777 family protein [Candidatus Omnitrophica bacterium]|nr:TIGR01777 family protein [Candidatus Omnitrophota bacterium]
MRIALTGSSGFVGSALANFLIHQRRHEVIRLIRAPAQNQEGTAFWDPAAEKIDLDKLEGLDALIHLAGDNIAKGRWTPAKKELIRTSRVQATQFLSESLPKLKKPPAVFLSASAVGIYGSRGDETLNEDSPAGSGFLAEVGQAWEAATQPASQAGIRVVNLRFGMVLGAAGGALPVMTFPFRLGLGGTIGSGRQYMSWVALDDAVGAILHAIVIEQIQGPVNIVSPNPVTNREFTKTLGRVLWRPALFPLPAFAARLAFGEMADALLLASQRAVSARLKSTGYPFIYPRLDWTLRHVLGTG